MVIEGEVEGDLETTGVAICKGRPSARILGDSITVSGELRGNVNAPEMKLHLGMVVKGRCSIGEIA